MTYSFICQILQPCCLTLSFRIYGASSWRLVPTLSNGPGVVAHPPVSFLSNLFYAHVDEIPTSSAALVLGTRPMAGAGPCPIISTGFFPAWAAVYWCACAHPGQQRKLTGWYPWLLVGASIHTHDFSSCANYFTGTYSSESVDPSGFYEEHLLMPGSVSCGLWTGLPRQFSHSSSVPPNGMAGGDRRFCSCFVIKTRSASSVSWARYAE